MVQGSIPCASTNMLHEHQYVVPASTRALHVVVSLPHYVTFAAFDSFARTASVADARSTAELIVRVLRGPPIGLR